MNVFWNNPSSGKDDVSVAVVPPPGGSYSTPSTMAMKGDVINNKKQTIDQQQGCHGLNGTRIAILDIHLEGNLGDEFETTPLLKLLHGCGIHITAVLSSWINAPHEQLGYRSIRAHQYIDEIKSYKKYGQGFNPDKYDVVMLAPGPWRLCSIAKDWHPHIIDILVGGSVLDEDDENCHTKDDNSDNQIDTYIEQLSPKLILAREIHTYEKLVQQSTYIARNKIPTILSGDLTNSIKLHKPSVEYWKHFYRSQYGENSSIIIFSRSSNIDNVVEIEEVVVKLKTHEEGIVHIKNHNQVIFATSSEIEDGQQIEEWRSKFYKNGFMENQFAICQSMEQLFALIETCAQHIYTDRYHPGVLALMLNKPFDILNYPKEQSKLIGLSQVAATNTDAGKLKDMNEKAFASLLDTISKLKKRQPH